MLGYIATPWNYLSNGPSRSPKHLGMRSGHPGGGFRAVLWFSAHIRVIYKWNYVFFINWLLILATPWNYLSNGPSLSPKPLAVRSGHPVGCFRAVLWFSAQKCVIYEWYYVLFKELVVMLVTPWNYLSNGPSRSPEALGVRSGHPVGGFRAVLWFLAHLRNLWVILCILLGFGCNM